AVCSTWWRCRPQATILRSSPVIDKVLDWCCASRKTVVVALLIVTAVMAAFASRVEIKTVFGDLLPRNHPFVKVNEQFKQAYGGSNIVSIMIEVKEGDILNLPVLAKIKKITEEVALIPGADPFQVTSLASKKLKEITATTEGIATNPLMWPDLPRTDEDLYELRRAITNNPLVYGAYVSRDFKAALITVDFYDHLLDYRVFYDS